VEQTHLPEQQTLAAVGASFRARQSHGNRGKEFERMLEKTHHYYRVRGVADVDYIPNAFAYCSEGEFQRLPRELKARMGDGRTLKRVRTSGDYRGTLSGLGLAFDAKQFSDDRLQLKKIPRHQVEALCSFARARGIGGFMVYAVRAAAVYWVDAFTMRALCDQALTNKGMKTLNLSWFAANAVPIGRVVPGGLVEYATAILPSRAS
jgi:penicillin-binding protein-related factor A (putative recombinase)